MNGDDKLINDLSINSIQNDFDLLPKNEANLIPLKLIYERVIQNYYSDLTTLSETIQTKSNEQKKIEIFKFVQSLNQSAIKLLVLIRWAKKSRDVLKCKNICDFLEVQNSYFRGAADALHMVHQEMNAARIPSFDIPTAVDVLTTGTYSRLPTIIKEPISLPPLKTEEIKDAIEKLEDVTRLRLLCDEIIPKPMKKNYVIKNGSVRFTVENEFEATLKLEGKQQDNWRLLDLKIFVKPDDDLNHELIMPLQEYQLNNLKINAQNAISTDVIPLAENATLINSTQNPTNNQASSSSSTEETKPKKKWPLIELYRYLHSFCLSMHLEIFSLQIDYLIKTRWANQLRLNISPDKKTLQIYYWMANDFKNKQSKANILELSISTAEDKIVFYTNKEHTEEETNSSLIAKSLIYEYEKFIQCKLNIKCYQLLENGTKKELIDPLTSSSIKFDINSQKLNIERILERVTEIHAFSILYELRNILLGKSNTKIAVHKCNPNDIIEKNFYNSETTDEQKDKLQPELIICYRINHYIKITVDERTGRIVVTEYNEQGTDNINSFIQEKIKIVEDEINKDMTNAVEHLMNLRKLIIINEIELLSIYIGLEPSKKLLINQEESKRLINNNELFQSQNIIYLRYPNYPNYYIIIYIDNEAINSTKKYKHDISYFKVWLVSTQKKDPLEFLGFTLIMNLDISQLLEDSNDSDNDIENDDFFHHRKRRCTEEPSVWDKTKNLTLDLEILSKIEAACRYKIAYSLLTTQLKNLHIPYYFVSTKSNNHAINFDSPLSVFDLIIKIRVKDIIPDVIRKCFLGDYILKLNNDLYITATGNTLNKENNSIPFEKFSIKNPVKGIARGIEVVAKYQVKPGELPINEDFSIGDISFSNKTKVLTFTYNKINNCIYKILNIWKGLLLLRIIASQAYTNKDILQSNGMSIDKINLLKTKILFHEKNFVEFALNSSLDSSNSSGINIIFGIKGEKTPIFYEEKQFLVEDFLKDYNVINFLLKLKTKYKLFKNINAIKKSREQIDLYSPLKIEKKSLEKIKMIYNNQYIIEIGQIADNLVGILYSDNSINDIRNLTTRNIPPIILPQFNRFIDFVTQLVITGGKSQQENSIIKSENDQGNMDENQKDSVCLKIPNGIIFDIRYIDEVMVELQKIMNSVSYMDWLYAAIPQIEQTKASPQKGSISYSKNSTDPLYLIYNGQSFELSINYDFKMNKWTMHLKVNNEDINSEILIKKILNLANPIIGFKSLTQLMLLPPDIAKEILDLINTESKPNDKGVTSEICLTIPEGLPSYLPRSGESAICSDFQNKRVGLFCHITYNDTSVNGVEGTKHSLIIPFFYNWESRFFCEWDINPEISKLKTFEECKTLLQSQSQNDSNRFSKLNLLLVNISMAKEQKGEKEPIKFAFTTLNSMTPEQYKVLEFRNN
ncbi:MED14-domain-containing protein [Piromyces finnis]|uniref:Mediator of RNA polymerase II transcription subunit 14 n=1 Tax=Piromyces finnis TaxID=1754191 RepID=A0A1Y1VA24_9FUNG|nr:MED14-domain-containing protein [Piromyces finnis]|eukprot:ORX51007.1 MED14-domain-containing protein [Piromyces finnis]